MENEVKKYELITNMSGMLIAAKTVVFALLFWISLYINSIIMLNKIWNLCFLFPVLLLYLTTISLHIISIFKVGSYDNYNIEEKTKHKQNLMLSANIIFLVS